ncbi:hypothetical protein GW17_00024757 [Ensete ventricosum]|nr:hypothetical protein GW17_00024757 [Ensete ventricosum]
MPGEYDAQFLLLSIAPPEFMRSTFSRVGRCLIWGMPWKHRSTGVEGERREETSRIAFRMKSEVEVLNDGFKWRKYGKKSVKNSPNPRYANIYHRMTNFRTGQSRNYYRCSTEGCWVKKRVERDREDPSYVITTYEGIHNHMSPGVVYYTNQDSVSGRYYVAGFQVPPDS